MKKIVNYYHSLVRRYKYLRSIKSFNVFLLLVKPQDYEKRVGVCFGCKYIEGNNCNVCGCNVYDKAKYITEVCPKGKWL
jgi:hypothetical protein